MNPLPLHDAAAADVAHLFDSALPHLVIVGGTLRLGSTSERLARHCEAVARSLGATTSFFRAAELELPMYAPDRPVRHPVVRAFVREVQRCDGMIVSSPGYHGGISGLLKNALDYLEELRADARPYLHGRAVGCIASAAGWQGANSTLTALRSVAHALRGWPTPLGVAVNSAQPLVDAAGGLNPDVAGQLEAMVRQVLHIAGWHPLLAGPCSPPTTKEQVDG